MYFYASYEVYSRTCFFLDHIVLIFLLCLFTEQLHQNVEVFGAHVPTAEFIRAISAARKFLLPLSASSPDDSGHLFADPHHYSHPAHRCLSTDCH